MLEFSTEELKCNTHKGYSASIWVKYMSPGTRKLR